MNLHNDLFHGVRSSLWIMRNYGVGNAAVESHGFLLRLKEVGTAPRPENTTAGSHCWEPAVV